MKPSLRGRWTWCQLRALVEAGWLDPDACLLDVTTHSDACRWFIIGGVQQHVGRQR